MHPIRFKLRIFIKLMHINLKKHTINSKKTYMIPLKDDGYDRVWRSIRSVIEKEFKQ